MWKVVLYTTEKDDNPSFVLLHCFRKKIQRLPKKELEIAKARMENYLKRRGS